MTDVSLPPVVSTAMATRRGVREHNCDAAAVFTSADHTTAAVVVDGIGNSAKIASDARLVADVAARISATRGGLAGLLAAASLMADHGADGDMPDAVAVVAIARTGQPTPIFWVGDSRAYGWNGQRLRQYSTDHTVGQHLRLNGVPLELAEDHDNWLRTSLAHAVVATVYEAEIPTGELVLLASDGVPDGLSEHDLAALLREHDTTDLHAVSKTIVAAARQNDQGYRDDATVVLIRDPSARL